MRKFWHYYMMADGTIQQSKDELSSMKIAGEWYNGEGSIEPLVTDNGPLKDRA